MGNINRQAIHVSSDEVFDFNCAADTKMNKEQIVEFLSVNSDIYFEGKEWGFNDTEVREKIGRILSLTQSVSSYKLGLVANE